MQLRSLWVLPLAAVLLGCPPKIGKKCTLSTDCSQLGDRLCDTTQPEGYCTIFNCQPDSCPQSICVAFSPTLDPACQNADDGRWPRFQRTFCLAACGDDGDCRDGYQCVHLDDPREQAFRAAQVVDTGANDGGLGYGVCMVRVSTDDGGVPNLPDAGVVSYYDGGPAPPICYPPDAGLGPDGSAPWKPYEPDGGAGGAGGGP